ncbi:unnamed protein product [Scytosiphon promiscuus]
MTNTPQQQQQRPHDALWARWLFLKEGLKKEASGPRTCGDKLHREVDSVETFLKDLTAQLEASAAKVAELEAEVVQVERAGQEALEAVHRELAKTKEVVLEGEKRVAAMIEESATKLSASAAELAETRRELVLERERSAGGASAAQAPAKLEQELERTRSDLTLAREKAEAEKYVFSAKNRARERKMTTLEAELEAARQAAEQATAEAEEERRLNATLLRQMKGLEERTVPVALENTVGEAKASSDHNEAASSSHEESRGIEEVHTPSDPDDPAGDERDFPPRDRTGQDPEAPADQGTPGDSAESEPSATEPVFPRVKSRVTFRVWYDDGEQDVVDTFLAFFRRHFGERMEHDRDNLFVSVSVPTKTKADTVCEMVARYLEHAIRVSREEYVQPSDFILMRVRVACSGEAVSGPYLLPAGQHGIAGLTMVRTLADEFGVMMDRVKASTLDPLVPPSDIGDTGDDGDDGDGANSARLDQGARTQMALPEYHGAPPLPEVPEEVAKRHRVFQIWGLATAVWAAFLHAGGTREMNIAGSLELWAKPEDVRNVIKRVQKSRGVSVSCEEREGDRTVAVLAGRNSGALENVYLRAVDDLSAALPHAIQHVDMGHVGAMRQFATRAAARQANFAAGRGGGKAVEVRLLFLWRVQKVVVLLLSGPSREKERLRTMKRACDFLLAGKMRWIDRNVNLRVTATFKGRSKTSVRYADSSKDVRPGIVLFLSELAGTDLWFDGLKLTGKVAEGADRTTMQAKLEAECGHQERQHEQERQEDVQHFQKLQRLEQEQKQQQQQQQQQQHQHQQQRQPDGP